MSLQVIQVLLDREEDAKNVCRLGQLSKCDDGICDRVGVDVVVSSYLCAGALLKGCGVGNICVTRFFVIVKNMQGLSVLSAVFSKYSLNLDRRMSNNFAGRELRNCRVCVRSGHFCRQQLHFGESWIDLEFAIEEFRAGTSEVFDLPCFDNSPSTCSCFGLSMCSQTKNRVEEHVCLRLAKLRKR